MQVDIPINLANQIIDLTKEYLLRGNNPSHSVFVRKSELLQDAQDFIFQELIPFWGSFLHKNVMTLGLHLIIANHQVCVCTCVCVCVYVRAWVCGCVCALSCMCVTLYIICITVSL